jgi:hypothetical protein
MSAQATEGTTMKTLDLPTRDCEAPSCRRVFVPRRRAQRFCSRECRAEFHNAEIRAAIIAAREKKTAVGIADGGS